MTGMGRYFRMLGALARYSLSREMAFRGNFLVKVSVEVLWLGILLAFYRTVFAKTRFVADVGGSLFLLNRYLLKPYRAGAFTKGAQGRTKALIKAGLAAAATAKLVSNARENAKANPTLCKTVAGPLGQLASSLNGVVDGLKSGSLDAGAIGGISGLLGSLQQKSGQAGVPVQEQPVPLR